MYLFFEHLRTVFARRWWKIQKELFKRTKNTKKKNSLPKRWLQKVESKSQLNFFFFSSGFSVVFICCTLKMGTCLDQQYDRMWKKGSKKKEKKDKRRRVASGTWFVLFIFRFATFFCVYLLRECISTVSW